MNAENAGRTVGGLNRLFDGSPLNRARAQEGGTLHHRRLSLHLLMQPGVAGRLFAHAEVRDIGFLWRSLVAWPAPVPDDSFMSGGVVGSAALQAFHARLVDLLRRPLPVAPGTQNELAPRQLVLAPEAHAMFVGLFNQARAKARGDGPLATVGPYAKRAGEHAMRLAAILTLYQDPEATEIPAAAMDGARRLVAWYLREMLRIHETAEPPDHLVKAQRLLTWIHGQTLALVYPRQVYRLGPYGIRTKDQAAKALATLESHGWLVRVPEGAQLDGAHRRDVWRMVPDTGEDAT
jgi:hypothetical protein